MCVNVIFCCSCLKMAAVKKIVRNICSRAYLLTYAVAPFPSSPQRYSYVPPPVRRQTSVWKFVKQADRGLLHLLPMLACLLTPTMTTTIITRAYAIRVRMTRDFSRLIATVIIWRQCFDIVTRCFLPCCCRHLCTKENFQYASNLDIVHLRHRNNNLWIFYKDYCNDKEL